MWIALFLLSFTQAHASVSQNATAQIKASIVQNSASGSTSAKSQPSQKLETRVFELKVVPAEGTKLNFDGPWELSVSGEIPFESGSEKEAKAVSLGKADFKKEAQAYELKVAGNAVVGAKSHYKLKYFLCSKENTWCKRLVQEGDIALP